MLAAQSSPVSGFVFVVAVLATSIVLVAGLAWASRRLLGLPVGALRALIAALLGFAAALILGSALRADPARARGGVLHGRAWRSVDRGDGLHRHSGGAGAERDGANSRWS